MADTARGRVWKFGDNIDTDQIIPGFAISLPAEEQRKYCFRSLRPGWVDLVERGDIIVAGENFGVGSSRPAARVFKDLGIACVVAESINGLFLRNSINFGLPAMTCRGVAEGFQEGETAEVDWARGNITNLSRGTQLTSFPMPQSLLDILDVGGILEVLRKQGYIN